MNNNILNEGDSILACNMAAISADQRAGHIEITKELLSAVETTEELPDGYSFQLPIAGNYLLQAAQFVALERLCCPFLSFALELGAGATSFRLTLSGPPGVKPFLVAEFGDAWPG